MLALYPPVLIAHPSDIVIPSSHLPFIPQCYSNDTSFAELEKNLEYLFHQCISSPRYRPPPRSTNTQVSRKKPNRRDTYYASKRLDSIYDHIILGTHDSGAYVIDPFTFSRETPLSVVWLLQTVAFFLYPLYNAFSRTQNLDIYTQLQYGVRFLDLRVGLVHKNNRFPTSIQTSNASTRATRHRGLCDKLLDYIMLWSSLLERNDVSSSSTSSPSSFSLHRLRFFRSIATILPSTIARLSSSFIPSSFLPSTLHNASLSASIYQKEQHDDQELLWVIHGPNACVPLSKVLHQINRFHNHQHLAGAPVQTVILAIRPIGLTKHEIQHSLVPLLKSHLDHHFYVGDQDDLRNFSNSPPHNIISGVSDLRDTHSMDSANRHPNRKQHSSTSSAPLHLDIHSIDWAKDIWVNTYHIPEKLLKTKDILYNSSDRTKRNHLFVLGWTLTPQWYHFPAWFLSFGQLVESLAQKAAAFNTLFPAFFCKHRTAFQENVNVVFFDYLEKHHANFLTMACV